MCFLYGIVVLTLKNNCRDGLGGTYGVYLSYHI